jgi:hypothetical protein
MDKTSFWAALYFIALMTFGNYVLFNLLVAILVEGFSTEDEPKKSIEVRIREDAMHAIEQEIIKENSDRLRSANGSIKESRHNSLNNQKSNSKSKYYLFFLNQVEFLFENYLI